MKLEITGHEEEEVKMFSADQPMEFMNSLDKVCKESKEIHVLTTFDYKILWWFKHKLVKLLNGEGESKTLTFSDKNVIDMLHKIGLSIGEIAFTVNRSKSTIHAYLNKK